VRTIAIVPIKAFTAAKSRLATTLAPQARQELARAMLSDVLAALDRSRAVSEVAVVTADRRAAAIAQRAGAVVVADYAQAGQSAAAAIGTSHALSRGFDRGLLVPGDVPLIDPLELDALLAGAARAALGLAIVPDRHGAGTNALVVRPPNAVEPSFGRRSLERHIAQARDLGLHHSVETVASLALDVDTGADLVALAAALINAPDELGAQTRVALEMLGAATGWEGSQRGGVARPDEVARSDEVARPDQLARPDNVARPDGMTHRPRVPPRHAAGSTL